MKLKKTLLYILVTYIVLFGYYALVSNGLGNKPFYLQMRRFIPMTIILVLVTSYLSTKVRSSFLASFGVTSIAWMLTYPTLYKLTYAKTMPYFSYHFDIVFAVYSFVGLTIFAFLMLNFKQKKIADIVISLIQFVLLLIPIQQLVYYAYYGRCISENAILAIYQTNVNEAKEYLLSGLGYGGIALSVILTLLLFVGIYKFNKKNLVLQTNSAISMKTIAVLSIVSIAALGYIFGNIFIKTGYLMLHNDVRRYFVENNKFKEKHCEIYDKLVVTQKKKIEKPHTVIMVIGESVNKNYMSVYKDTPYDSTPWLKSKLNDPDYFVFPHVYTSITGTVLSLERALTTKNQYNNVEFYESVTVLDIAKKAGYHTSWLSNQGTIDIDDTPITLVGKIADTAKWTNQDSDVVQYDGHLLEYLKTIDPNKNNFIVLHLMGSHDNYQNRYPREFAKWGNPDKNEPEINYYNSIYYTDWLLSEVQKYASENLNLSAMVYFSDHGTIPTKKRLADETEFSALRVPMFVYLSKDYQENFPETTNVLKNNKTKYFTNDLVYELMCGIFNVNSNAYDEENSIASDKYKFTRESLRTILGKKSLIEDTAEN